MIGTTMRAKDEDEKVGAGVSSCAHCLQKAMREVLSATKFPVFLSAWNKLIEANGTEWCVGKTMTCADIALANFVLGIRSGGDSVPGRNSLRAGKLDYIATDLCDSYEHVVKVTNAVGGDPRVQAFMAKYHPAQ